MKWFPTCEFLLRKKAPGLMQLVTSSYASPPCPLQIASRNQYDMVLNKNITPQLTKCSGHDKEQKHGFPHSNKSNVQRNQPVTILTVPPTQSNLTQYPSIQNRQVNACESSQTQEISMLK